MSSMRGAEGVVGPATAQGDQKATPSDATTHDLEDRFDTIGWGLLFLLFGAMAQPSGMAAYVSAAAVGALLLGLNVARRAAGVHVRWFSIVLGTTALIAGLGAIAGLSIDAFALFFVLLGLVTIAGAVIRSPRTS